MGRSRRQQAADALASVAGTAESVGADDAGLPVLPAFHGLLPGLGRGQVVTVDGIGVLPLALLAGASQDGSWCGIVGLPEFGAVAAAELGCDLERLLLVDEPADRWADVTAVLLEAVDIVLLQPPARPQTGAIRRLTALARKSGSALIVAGPWEGASLRLRVETSTWMGVDQGHGHLHSRRVNVVAEGRGAGGRPRSAWLWLPGTDGSVSRAELASVTNMRDKIAAKTLFLNPGEERGRPSAPDPARPTKESHWGCAATEENAAGRDTGAAAARRGSGTGSQAVSAETGPAEVA